MHQAACFGDMLLSTAKVIFEAHMELTRRAEQCAYAAGASTRRSSSATIVTTVHSGVAPEVVRTRLGESQEEALVVKAHCAHRLCPRAKQRHQVIPPIVPPPIS